MAYRFVPFVNGEYYHIYNRGVNKRKIFLAPSDYKRALETVEYYLSIHLLRFSYYDRLSDKTKAEHLKGDENQRASLTAFVLMPNHFHLLLNQIENNAISNSLRFFENSYTKYFNTKYKRVGPLLQGAFKAVHIENDEQLLHVSRYIHLNPFSSRIVKTIEELEKYPWSSYPDYLNLNQKIHNFVQNEIILDQFTEGAYRSFVNEQSLYQQQLDEIKHLTME